VGIEPHAVHLFIFVKFEAGCLATVMRLPWRRGCLLAGCYCRCLATWVSERAIEQASKQPERRLRPLVRIRRKALGFGGCGGRLT
jgi:hypothetical protein